MLVDPWTDTAPHLRQLCRALNGCGVAADQIPQTIERLIRPPLLFGLSALQGDDGAAHDLRGDDRDAAAWLLCFKKGRPDPGTATWKALSEKEKKQARRLWSWLSSPHGLSASEGPSAHSRCRACAVLRAPLGRSERQGSIHILAPALWRQARRANVASPDRGATHRPIVFGATLSDARPYSRRNRRRRRLHRRNSDRRKVQRVCRLEPKIRTWARFA
jgi:hypothetical protein